MTLKKSGRHFHRDESTGIRGSGGDVPKYPWGGLTQVTRGISPWGDQEGWDPEIPEGSKVSRGMTRGASRSLPEGCGLEDPSGSSPPRGFSGRTLQVLHFLSLRPQGSRAEGSNGCIPLNRVNQPSVFKILYPLYLSESSGESSVPSVSLGILCILGVRNELKFRPCSQVRPD